MSVTTASAIPPPPHVPRLLTAAEFAALPNDPPDSDIRHELHDGRVVEMPRPGDIHASVSGNAIFHFKAAERAGHGKARSDVGVILRSNPDHVVGPDACFIANASLPLRLSPEGFLVTVPTIVVEVRSKNDTLAELQQKADEYLAAGVELVWVIDPIRGNAVVYETGRAPRPLAGADALPAGAIIPGFHVTIDEMLQV